MDEWMEVDNIYCIIFSIYNIVYYIILYIFITKCQKTTEVGPYLMPYTKK